MTDYKMTEELAKIITKDLLDGGKPVGNFIGHQNKTFTTPDDAHKVMEKLVERRIFVKFECFCIGFYIHDFNSGNTKLAYSEWLHINKERFCALAAMFMEGRK
jgi:hypothetical protein